MTPEQIKRSRKSEALERAAEILDGNPNGVPFEQELALRSVAGILRCEAAKLRERSDWDKQIAWADRLQKVAVEGSK